MQPWAVGSTIASGDAEIGRTAVYRALAESEIMQVAVGPCWPPIPRGYAGYGSST
jgi:hypothetical protein